VSSRVSGNPLERKSPRGDRSAAGDLSGRSIRIRWRSKALQAANDFREARERPWEVSWGSLRGATGRNVMRAIPERRAPGPVSGGKPLKGEPQGRYRHETRPEGPGEEETAERVRNPEGGTNPGEANRGIVDSPGLKRRRGPNSMRGAGSGPQGPASAGSAGQALKWAQPHERRSSGFGRAARPPDGIPKGTATFHRGAEVRIGDRRTNRAIRPAVIL